MPALALGAIGVVFGDIGTSPLYTLRECLKAAGVSPTNVYDIVSLILWSIIVVVTFKYVCFVMRANNNGEGGILALTALASGVAPARLRRVLLTLGVFGAAMFYGDSMITPAISVISAVEGVTLIDPHLSEWIVPIALIVLRSRNRSGVTASNWRHSSSRSPRAKTRYCARTVRPFFRAVWQI
jgi:KUP system potassium uptake protein